MSTYFSDEHVFILYGVTFKLKKRTMTEMNKLILNALVKILFPKEFQSVYLQSNFY